MSINDKHFLQYLQYITVSGDFIRVSCQFPEYEHIPKNVWEIKPVDAKSVYEHSYKGTKCCPVHEVNHSKIIPLLKLFKTLSHGLLSLLCRVLYKRYS